MSNIKRFGLVMLLLTLFTSLVSCGLFSSKYKEEAGVYKCVKIKFNGVESLNQYDYYNIELKANGDCIVSSKQKGSSQTYEAEATFTIEGELITVITKSGASTIKEEYKYIDGKIIMETAISGVGVYAEFERKQ